MQQQLNALCMCASVCLPAILRSASSFVRVLLFVHTDHLFRLSFLIPSVAAYMCLSLRTTYIVKIY